MSAQTLLDKLWTRHVVREEVDGPSLLYIDRHLVNEVTSPQAFEGLRLQGRKPWRVASILATADHNVPTTDRRSGIADPVAKAQVDALDHNCDDFNIPQFGLFDPRQGILHVVAPEQGGTLPGTTVVCGDSHTSTHGAFAALAFGIGTSDVEQVLATQCLLMKKPASMLVRVEGKLALGISSKDIVLALIGQIGTSGGTGYAIEFSGSTIRSLSMEARMTLCNMVIEAGARCGMVAVDDKTITYIQGRPMAPQGADWDAAVGYWRTLVSDTNAHFDRVVELNASAIRPMVTWGTSPDMVVTVDGQVPDPAQVSDPVKRQDMQTALTYMGLTPNTRMTNIVLDKVFIGSCTNARIEDLRIAANVVKGQRVATTIKQALVVPGSGLVKAQAEAEGLDKLFTSAGFEWREAGCSMCLGMNEDRLCAGERCASTSNRNFQGRQGPGGRTHLVSPAMAAAAAIAGHFVDVSTMTHPTQEDQA
ncbi:3-isopropylmalate dehydratase large subunit [Rhodoferax lithotrophicus]|uniref:3-isopropylmalate dehydratase large subunit n=1 Tax=Rhodoferax lithotrophicus TaxID=2798804 RepID=A0ABN6D3T3_9BURK|nr:3-isopropylmalate dehydratase large subunit [Rhodoferax sp. MIZ03]BCO25328.1 3-isopropylmalate dehydratase large subunit [Rhodoferax sp. MIZ03]